MAGDPPRRFFVEQSELQGETISLTGDIAHRLARVLRYRPGDEIVLTSGMPTEYLVRLDKVAPKCVTATVIGEQAGPEEPTVEVVLYQSLIRPNRFDYALEKGTEIGAARFVPVINARSQGHTEEAAASRAERWHRLITEAAEQCGRGRLPVVGAPMSFADAVHSATGALILPYEDESSLKLANHLRSLPRRLETVSVFIGPEGGYTPEEIALARAAGAAIVTLGHRTLRSETAAAVACAIILHELDG